MKSVSENFSPSGNFGQTSYAGDPSLRLKSGSAQDDAWGGNDPAERQNSHVSHSRRDVGHPVFDEDHTFLYFRRDYRTPSFLCFLFSFLASASLAAVVSIGFVWLGLAPLSTYPGMVTT